VIRRAARLLAGTALGILLCPFVLALLVGILGWGLWQALVGEERALPAVPAFRLRRPPRYRLVRRGLRAALQRC
jgi:hypothetical protein